CGNKSSQMKNIRSYFYLTILITCCRAAFSLPSATLQLEFSSHPLVAVITKIKLSCKGEIEHGKK
ncbi:hypothetical protein L5H80_10805, partial [Enterococcus faecium]|nr:hypothetical protein [Enterococcus faecium]